MNQTKNKNPFWAGLLIAAGDSVTILLAALLSAWRLLSFAEDGGASGGVNWPFTILYGVVLLVMLFNFDMYTVINRKIYDVFLSSLISWIAAAAISTVFFYFASGSGAVRFQIWLFMATSFVLLVVWRVALNILSQKLHGHEKLLVIEDLHIDNAFARKIKYSCLDWFDSWYTQIDTSDEAAVEAFIQGEFSQYDNIFITQSICEPVKKRLISEAISAKKDIYTLPSLYDINMTKFDMVQFDDTPSFRIRPFRLLASQKALKRMFDLVLSAAGLVIAAPFMAIIALVIKLDSPGRVFYTQKRVTQDGKVFSIYKFRTMVSDAEKLSGPVLAAGSDSRITRAGKILRATRLDELPQLINIFLGDMSIVGPRPERPFFVSEYCKTIEDYDKRLAVKAGLTGYAQVYARYDTSASDKLLYDLLYIRQYSFMLDVKIVLMTIRTMFTKEASEGVKPPVDYQKQSQNQNDSHPTGVSG